MTRSAMLALAILSSAGSVSAQTPTPEQATARAIFKQPVEINTTHSTGSTTVAAEALRQRFLAAGFPPPPTPRWSDRPTRRTTT